MECAADGHGGASIATPVEGSTTSTGTCRAAAIAEAVPSAKAPRGLNEMAEASQHWRTLAARLALPPHANKGEGAVVESSTQRIAKVILDEAGNSGWRWDTSDAALRSGQIGPLEAKCVTHLAN
jgi:hypothetical protein